MPKPLHTRSPKVVSFSVKRKQINFNLLERNSSQTSFQSTESYRHQPGYQTLLQEKEDQINQLKTELDKTQRELSASRHQTRLMENERHQFEASVTKTCSLEKDQIQLELNILKETHTEKMQYYSSTMNQLYKTIQVLKQRLSKYEDEAQEDQELFLDEHYDQYQAEYEFIKDAYLYTTQETTHQSSLWSSIQNTTLAIQHEIQNFHAWKSIPIVELVQLLKDDQKSNHPTTMKSLLFGRLKERK